MAGENSPPIPMSGAIPIAIGQPALVRIPIPGQGGLCIEFRPRGFVPKGGSTSTLFFQDTTGKRHLRLDYGYNKVTKTINYHWNQSGTHQTFGIADHAPVGRGGIGAYKAARYFRHAGCVQVVGAGGAAIGTAASPLGTAAGGVGGCIIGGAAGYYAGSRIAGQVYDWAEDTVFTPVPRMVAPSRAAPHYAASAR